MREWVGWRVHTDDGPEYHVWPESDALRHELEGSGCVCGPASELVETASGDRWLITHHSLDGREQSEKS